MRWIVALLLCVAADAVEPMTVEVQPGGYALLGPKVATVHGRRGDAVTAWRVICTSCGKTFAHGLATPATSGAGGPAAAWSIDFSTMDVADEVVIECQTGRGTIRSAPFRVGPRPATQSSR